MKIGLVLEGGAMRGMYTAGVLDTLMDCGIRADEVVGVSAGALFGVNYLSGQRGRAIRYNKKFNSDPNYLGLLPLLREGNIVSTEYAYDIVPHSLDRFDDETYKASGVPFFAVATNVRTGLPEYIRIESVFEQMDVLRASGSLPMVSQPVTIGDQQYLDGGISDSIPYHWMADRGCDRLIVVLTRDAGYRKKKAARAVELYRLRYPAVARQLMTRHTRYNWCIEELHRWEQDGRAFVICPSAPITIGSLEHDPEKLQQVYDQGIRDMGNRMDALRAYLGLDKTAQSL